MMFAEAIDALRRDIADEHLPADVRQMARSTLAVLESYVRLRLAEARRGTDPAGHALVKPQRP